MEKDSVAAVAHADKDDMSKDFISCANSATGGQRRGKNTLTWKRRARAVSNVPSLWANGDSMGKRKKEMTHIVAEGNEGDCCSGRRKQPRNADKGQGSNSSGSGMLGAGDQPRRPS